MPEVPWLGEGPDIPLSSRRDCVFILKEWNSKSVLYYDMSFWHVTCSDSQTCAICD